MKKFCYLKTILHCRTKLKVSFIELSFFFVNFLVQSGKVYYCSKRHDWIMMAFTPCPLTSHSLRFVRAPLTAIKSPELIQNAFVVVPLCK